MQNQSIIKEWELKIADFEETFNVIKIIIPANFIE